MPVSTFAAEADNHLHHHDHLLDKIFSAGTQIECFHLPQLIRCADEFTTIVHVARGP
jgi:hypothetical protein